MGNWNLSYWRPSRRLCRTFLRIILQWVRIKSLHWLPSLMDWGFLVPCASSGWRRWVRSNHPGLQLFRASSGTVWGVCTLFIGSHLRDLELASCLLTAALLMGISKPNHWDATILCEVALSLLYHYSDIRDSTQISGARLLGPRPQNTRLSSFFRQLHVLKLDTVSEL